MQPGTNKTTRISTKNLVNIGIKSKEKTISQYIGIAAANT